MTRRTGRSTRHGHGVSLLVAAATVMAYVAVTSAPTAEVSASSIPATLPTANPANFTPNVENGEVDSIWQIGSRVIIGGTFTTVANATQNGGAVYTRNRLAAFNATTGVVDTAFAPNVNGSVNAVIPSNDPASMYVAGTFTSIGGTGRQRIARVSTATGQVITTFNAGTVNGQVRDIRLVGSTLYLAGDFSTVGTSSRSRLAALNADTGAVLGTLNLPFAGVHNGGSTNVFKIEVTPDGGRLLAIGNFATVAGVNRRQIAMIDLTTSPASLAGWHTNFYTSTCASVFNTYMRDLDISEDGTFAVVSTTGAYRANTACDTIARFPVQTNAANLAPTWINYTGGDTSYAVEIHDGVAYVGGHMRWFNNPFAGDSAGAGAIPREGIAALDVVNGLPFSWNPGRARGVGLFDFHVTATGLWAGSDTLTWAGEQRHRLAFFPFAGGIAVPPDVVGSLPNDVYTLGRLSGGGTTQDDVQRRFYTGSGAPGATTVTSGTVQWRNTRGAFMVGSTLFAGQSNGTFTRRSFNGTTFGAATTINLFNNTIIADLPNITGMFYDSVDARIYYTMSGQNSLFYRGFTPESAVISAARFTATGSVGSLNPTRVRGMFLSGGNIFFADNTTGNLFRIGFAGGAVSGSAVLADASVDWRGRDMFVWTGTPTQTTNQPPTASFTSTCSGLVCEFDASDSADDLGITSYEWSFPGGATGIGLTTEHEFPAAGQHTVSLTVRDGPGLFDTDVQQITVEELPNEPPEAAFTYTCSALACDFNAASSSDDVSIASYEWDFGGDGAGSGITAHHDFSGPGAFAVTLTVTDGEGASDSESQDVQVTDVVAGGVAFRAAVSSNANTTNASVVVPASVQAGDQLVLVVTINRSTTVSTPAGWTLLGQAADGTPDMLSFVFTRTANAASPGSAVSTTLVGTTKTSMVLLAYSGAAAVTGVVSSVTGAATTTHVTPVVAIADAGSFVLSYWSDKTSGNTGWSVPGGVAERAESLGSSGGQIGAVAGDSGPLAAGTWPGASATSSASSSKAIMWSIVIAPI